MTAARRIGHAALMGVVCGTRTFTGPAALAVRGRVRRGRARLSPQPPREAAGDKPLRPAPTSLTPLAERIASGALSGGARSPACPAAPRGGPGAAVVVSRGAAGVGVVGGAAARRLAPPPWHREATCQSLAELYVRASAVTARHYRRALTLPLVARALACSPRQLQRT